MQATILDFSQQNFKMYFPFIINFPIFMFHLSLSMRISEKTESMDSTNWGIELSAGNFVTLSLT